MAVREQDILTPDESLVSESGNLYAEGFRNPAKSWFRSLERSRHTRRDPQTAAAICLRKIRKALAACQPAASG